VQGITGQQGLYSHPQMIAYGTNVVGGVTPGKGGPVGSKASRFLTWCAPRERTTGANATVIYVPAAARRTRS
jgi:succinyl-CoA synthetase alpha subunit